MKLSTDCLPGWVGVKELLFVDTHCKESHFIASILLKTFNVANLLGRHVYILSRPNLLPRESGYCASVWVECCVG